MGNLRMCTALRVPLCRESPTNQVEAGADERAIGPLLEKMKEEAVRNQRSKGYDLAKISDPGLLGSSAVIFMQQQLGVIRMARRALLDSERA